MRVIAGKFPEAVIKYSTGLERLILYTNQGDDTAIRQVSVTVYWGDTAVGKTHRVRTLFPGVYPVGKGKFPWDQYTNQDAILFDEFNPSEWKITDLNSLCDKWSVSLQARYNNRSANWTKVFFCANSPQNKWYEGERNGALNAAFLRRISKCFHVLKRQDAPGYNEETDCVNDMDYCKPLPIPAWAAFL